MGETLGFLGPLGSFTHQAALKYDPQATLVPFDSIKSILVNSANCTKIIVPFYNSLVGFVEHAVDNLFYTTYSIQAQVYLDIEHCLLTNETNLDDIKVVYSHLKVQTHK